MSASPPPSPRNELRTEPRFPSVPQSRGHYESFYLKACHPHGGLGVWVRYTVHKRPGRAPKGFMWFALFDAASGISASKVEHDDPRAGPDCYLAMGDSQFAPGRVRGQAQSAQLDAAWELEFDHGEGPLLHLPAGWMYRAAVPRTKVLSPHPAVTFRGWLRAGERRIEVEGWPGMIGHNWGSEHAKRAIWVHGTNFTGHEQSWLDVVVAKVALGGVTSPWIASGALSLDGCRYRLGGPHRVRQTVIDATPEHCRFVLCGDGVRVEGVAASERRNFVGWIYAQPSGTERQTVNCSIADIRLSASRPGSDPVTLEVAGGGAYELQMDERYPPIPIQPFPDG